MQSPGRNPTDEIILAMLAEGKFPAEIAARLGTTIGVVKTRIEAMQAPAPVPVSPPANDRDVAADAERETGASRGNVAQPVLSLLIVSALLCAAAYLLLGGGEVEQSAPPLAMGTVRAVIESGTREAGSREPWTVAAESPFVQTRFASADGLNLQGGFLFIDAETGRGSAWALSPELDRAPWANQLSNDLRWIVGGGPGDSYAYDRKLERTLQWPQGGVRIIASFENATLFQVFHAITGENNPQGGDFRLWVDGERRSARVPWPFDAPMPAFDARVSVNDHHASVAYTRLQELHVVRFDVEEGDFTQYWRAGLRSDGDRLVGLFPTDAGFLVAVEPAISGLDGVDLYRGEWQGAPATVIAHHFSSARAVYPSPDGVHFAVNYGSGAPDTAVDPSHIPQVEIYNQAFQPVARVLSATASADAWFAGGGHLALRTSRGALVFDVRTLELGPFRLASGEIVDAWVLSPSPGISGLVLVDGAGIAHVEALQVRRLAASGLFSHPQNAVWSPDGTEFGFVLPGAADSRYVEGSWPAPVVDAIPFADAPRAVVANTGSCADLLESPSSQANVLGCLPNGAPLTIAESLPDVPDDSGLVASGVAFWTDERESPRRHFVRIATEDGGEGWLALEHLEWEP